MTQTKAIQTKYLYQRVGDPDYSPEKIALSERATLAAFMKQMNIRKKVEDIIAGGQKVIPNFNSKKQESTALDTAFIALLEKWKTTKEEAIEKSVNKNTQRVEKMKDQLEAVNKFLSAVDNHKATVKEKVATVINVDPSSTPSPLSAEKDKYLNRLSHHIETINVFKNSKELEFIIDDEKTKEFFSGMSGAEQMKIKTVFWGYKNSISNIRSQISNLINILKDKKEIPSLEYIETALKQLPDYQEKIKLILSREN